MLRIQQAYFVFSRRTRLAVFAAVGLCLLMAMADDVAAQYRSTFRYATPARLAPGYVVDGAYVANFQQFGFYQTKWRRWPSFSPRATDPSPTGQRSPLGSPIIDIPKATREDKTLPPKRDTIGDTSNDPLIRRDNGVDRSEQLFPDDLSIPTTPDSPPALPGDATPKPKDPLGNPFGDDKQGIDPIPGLPKDELLPPTGDGASGRLPRHIVAQVPQTSMIPSESLAAKAPVQSTALSLARPLSDAAPRPDGVDIEPPHPKRLPPVGRLPVAVAPPKLRQPEIGPPRIAEPISTEGETPRKPAPGSYNPLRLRPTNGPTSTLTPSVRQSSHQQATPRRRNPLR